MATKADLHCGDKDRRWFLQNRWRSDIVRYGRLCEQLERAERGTDEHLRLLGEVSKAVYELFTRAAECELRAEKVTE